MSAKSELPKKNFWVSLRYITHMANYFGLLIISKLEFHKIVLTLVTQHPKHKAIAT